MLFVQSFAHLFQKHLLMTGCVIGTLPSSGDTEVTSILCGAQGPVGENGWLRRPWSCNVPSAKSSEWKVLWAHRQGAPHLLGELSRSSSRARSCWLWSLILSLAQYLQQALTIGSSFMNSTNAAVPWPLAGPVPSSVLLISKAPLIFYWNYLFMQLSLPLHYTVIPWGFWTPNVWYRVDIHKVSNNFLQSYSLKW